MLKSFWRHFPSIRQFQWFRDVSESSQNNRNLMRIKGAFDVFLKVLCRRTLTIVVSNHPGVHFLRLPDDNHASGNADRMTTVHPRNRPPLPLW